jgi:hypothetical protein
MNKQIDDGGSVTANLISKHYVAKNVIAEDEVKSVGGLSIRDYFAAFALQGLICHNGCASTSDEDNSRVAYELADAMIQARKGSDKT